MHDHDDNSSLFLDLLLLLAISHSRILHNGGGSDVNTNKSAMLAVYSVAAT